MNRQIFTVSIAILTIVAVGLIVNSAGANASQAQSKIAVVSIPKIMAQSKYAQSLQDDVSAKRDSSLAELEKLRTQMEAVKADMDTRKPGSDDHINLKRDLLQKRALAEAQKEFLQEELMALNKQIMEQLYAKILETVRDIAQARGIELVLDSDEVELPAPSVNELTMMIQTHKVLHYADYIDITDDVIKTIDAR